MIKGISQKVLGKLMPGMDELIAMQKQLQKMTFTGESADGNVKVVLKGTMELEDIKIDEDFLNSTDSKTLTKAIKKAYKEAVKSLQKQLRGVMGM